MRIESYKTFQLFIKDANERKLSEDVTLWETKEVLGRNA